MDEFESRNTLIWGVHITRDFTIITGDSLGNTQFWDGHTGTLIESFKAHKADVLCLCVNEDEDTVFSSGVDSKVVSFKLTVTNQTQKPQWVRTVATRAHTHDVRALSVLGSGNMLVSGGVDTKLGVYSLSKFFKSQPRMVPAFPHHPLVSIASDANILMYQWQNSLRFWKLGETDLESTVLQSPPAQLLQMNAKGDNHIVCSAITSCSKWVAFSDISHVSMFRVNMITEDSETVKVSRVLPLPPNLLPAQKMVFTKDGSKLICATNQHSLQVLETGDEVTIAASFCLPGNEEDLPAMCLLAASDNGRWVACVDSLNAVNVLDLKYTKHHSTLPTFGSHVTALAFQPETQHLAIVCANKQIFIYHTKSSKLTQWSKQAASKGLPKQWVQRHNKVVDIAFSPACRDVMILQDHDLFALIDMREPLPDPDVKLFDKKFLPEGNRKRANSSSQDRYNAKKSATPNKQKAKANEEDALEGKDESSKDTKQNAFKICKKYGPLLFLGFCQDESMVVVERSWVNVVETLPPALSRKRYGRS